MNIQSKFKESGFQISCKSCKSDNPLNPLNPLNPENPENPENPDPLLEFLKENYPQIIRDNEIKWNELKTALGLPIDEKVNGYGLNFVGRNVANARYQQKTAKELKINETLSKNFDTTQNMVLKGENLDCLKILKSHYSGQIKCIYIDPPYNTSSDEFVYPDKFDKEEAEVLGLANISEADFDRMQFSFRTKKSHNGWLSFMYPRLMLARDLLAKNGVIFISIDDNEQANLKLLCDEIFGEENLVNQFIWINNSAGRQIQTSGAATTKEYILCYAKDILQISEFSIKGEYAKSIMPDIYKGFTFEVKEDTKGKYVITHELNNGNSAFNEKTRPSLVFDIFYNPTTKEIKTGDVNSNLPNNFVRISPKKISNGNAQYYAWRWSKDKIQNEAIDLDFVETKNVWSVFTKRRDYNITTLKDTITNITTVKGANDLSKLELDKYFDYPKPVELIKILIETSSDKNSLILDFFAGSGTTGQAVMQLNADDGGNRKFILCQIDDPINESKPAYKFCMENNLPPVISSITCERIKRAGEKTEKEIEEKNGSSGMFNENKQEIPDTGYKVFDLTDAPKLELENDGQIILQNTENDPLSRIYNMIFSVGIDNPNATMESVLENCMYKIDNNNYITNAEELDKTENKHFLSEAIKTGKVFIDGWTASINATLQNYKEDVKIVF